MTTKSPRRVPGLAGIDHVSLSVSDLPRSEQWYRDVLGFRVVRRLERQLFNRSILQCKRYPIVLGLTQHHTNEGAPSADHETGLDHIAFRLDPGEELDSWQTRLDRLGIAYSSPSDALLVLRDPDGIQIEIVSILRALAGPDSALLTEETASADPNTGAGGPI